MSTVYVTTAIPYVNADPHVGFALEAVIADAVARHHRCSGADVRLLTGTDDNSLKSLHAAEREGVAVPDLVARYARRFRDLSQTLDLSTDDFIATSTDPRHRPGVEKLWRACAASGDLYTGAYRGRYCLGCERFLDDDEHTCDEHPGEVQDVEEDNWFFRLSRYASALEDLLESGRLQVLPYTRRNEMLSVIRSGLRDISVSRSAERARGWGIPVPDDPTQVVYVWFDALANYVNALGYAQDGTDYDRWWRRSDERVHVVGKDIVRFHALYWPAMLLSAGEPLPTTVLSHGFVTVDGRKMGKSVGNALDPADLVARYGVDTVRYFLLRHIRTTEDGDVGPARLEAAHDADLADQLGNLVSRVVSMIQRYEGGVVPCPEGTMSAGGAPPLDRGAIHQAVADVFELVAESNREIVRAEPWVLARRRDAGDAQAGVRLRLVLGGLAATLRVVAERLRPFLPSTADEIARRVGGRAVETGPPLFPKRADLRRLRAPGRA